MRVIYRKILYIVILLTLLGPRVLIIANRYGFFRFAQVERRTGNVKRTRLRLTLTLRAAAASIPRFDAFQSLERKLSAPVSIISSFRMQPIWNLSWTDLLSMWLPAEWLQVDVNFKRGWTDYRHNSPSWKLRISPVVYSSRSNVMAFGTQVRGFAPGRSRRIFRAKKSSARLPSEGN
jgi:hypothetical protein